MKVHDINTSEMHYNMLEFARFRRFFCCRDIGLLRRYFILCFCYCNHAALLVIKTSVKVFCRNFVSFALFGINLVFWCVYVCVHTLSGILYLLVISVMNYKITSYFKFKYKNY